MPTPISALLPPRLYGGVRIVNRPSLANVRRLDGAIIPMVNRMMRNGIAIDKPALFELSSDLQRLMDETYSAISGEIPREALEAFIGSTVDQEDATDISEAPAEMDPSVININSPEQLADMLFTHMGLGKEKKLKTTSNGKRISTGKKQLEMIKDEHPIIGLILKYREYAKLKSTYADKLPRVAIWNERTQTFRVHCQILLTRTETGRLATRDVNLQNIPSRSKLGKLLRRCFIAAPGKVLLSRDFSQIELRVLAHLANDPTMIAIFKAGGDIHDMTTMAMYKLTMAMWEALPKDERKKMRTPVKNLQFGIVYGLTDIGLQQGLLINDPPIVWDTDQCQAFIDQWYDMYSAVRAYMQEVYNEARIYGMVCDLFGRTRITSGINSVHRYIQSAALREAGNMPVQSGAQGVIKLAMARCEDATDPVFNDAGIYVEPLIQIHDELIWEVDEDWVDIVSDYMGELMCVDIGLKVPLKSEAGVGRRWEK